MNSIMEYTQFVEQIRVFEKKSENISEAVEKAVDHCIKNEREIWKKEGEERFASLLQILTEKGKTDDIKRISVDRELDEIVGINIQTGY